MKSILTALTLSSIAMCSGLAAPVVAEENKPARVMTMTGLGEVSAQPDTASVSLGVVSQADTARMALDANNQAMTAVTATVKGLGIKDRDMQTSQFSINPNYHYPKQSSDGERPAPKITGYTVSNTLNVTVRDLDKLGPALDQIVSAGSNQINSIGFTIDDTRSLEDAARKLAVQDAVAKAELYASSAGVKLGKLVSISEQAAGPIPQFDMARPRMMAQEAAGAVPVARGEQTISVQVHMTWSIE